VINPPSSSRRSCSDFILLHEDSCLCSDAKGDHMDQNRHNESLLECQVGEMVKELAETGTTMTVSV
jgi:hypothetical protein